METQQLVKIDLKEFGIEESKANLILQAFEPFQIKMAELEDEFTVITSTPMTDVMVELKAAELLKKYVKIRTGRNEVHKNEKAFFLNAGRFVDRIKNDANAETEKREEKLDAIKNHFINLEKERINNLAVSRCEILKEFEFDGSLLNLGSMDDNIWISFLSGTKLAFEAKKAEEKRILAEKIEAENAAVRERARIEAENKRLKAEADEKERELEIERKKVAEEKAAIEEKNKIELAKQEAFRKSDQEKADKILEDQRKTATDKLKKEKEIADAKLKAERDAKEKAESELRISKEKEIAAEEAKQAEIKAKKEADEKAAAAPDKEKMLKQINDLSLQLHSANFKNQSVAISINAKFDGFKKWAIEQINTL